VVKNTLSRLAAEKAGRDDLKPHLTGPIALAFGYDDPVLPAKLLSDFAQKTGKPQVKAILFEGQLFGQEAMDQLKTLRPRDELLALMLSTLKAPFSKSQSRNRNKR
jgi:large subunit ribosomal protein L10